MISSRRLFPIFFWKYMPVWNWNLTRKRVSFIQIQNFKDTSVTPPSPKKRPSHNLSLLCSHEHFAITN
jgi:hypothetical protein